MEIAVAPAGDAVQLAALGNSPAVPHELSFDQLADFVRTRAGQVRWVWADSSEVYSELLRRGVTVAQAVDLRLVHHILRGAQSVRDLPIATAPSSAWDQPPAWAGEDSGETLFGSTVATGFSLSEVIAEFDLQQQTLTAVDDGGKLLLLCHAESIGGLIAQELNATGMPFDQAHHDRLLRELLGEPSPWGGRPARMETLCREIQTLLAQPHLNPDSPVEVLRALRRQGLEVRSTRKWELQELEHPVIKPLLDYKKLSRLLSANGWAWLQTWVDGGRFRADWVAGGVVTGRWASRGGGAMQLPRQIRSSVRALPGWKLVVADAAQLEPRVLAAMAQDRAMADACRGADLYQGLVDAQVVETRERAKIAVLAAMYGSTSGDAGALLARLARAFPAAMATVEQAARAGEQGKQVTTWLGRTSPAPSEWWRHIQGDAQLPEAGEADVRRARQVSRQWGRFTRNFVVQGTAAEWALCWLGLLRRSLRRWSEAEQGPEIAYFLHDEVMVHTPAEHAPAVESALRDAASEAGRLLFGATPVEFALNVATVDSYDQAK